MAEKETYLIQKVTVDVFATSTDQGKLVERNVRGLLETQVFPAIENFLESYAEVFSADTLQMGYLSLDLRFPDGIHLESMAGTDSIRSQIERQFQDLPIHQQRFDQRIEANREFDREGERSDLPRQEWLSHVDAAGQAVAFRFLSEYDKEFSTWLYFLENGTLPWWVNKWESAAFDLKQALPNWVGIDGFSDLVKITLAKPFGIQRLFMQHAPDDLLLLLKAIYQEVVDDIFVSEKVFKLTKDEQKIVTAFLFFGAVYGKGTTDKLELITGFIRRITQGNISQAFANKGASLKRTVLEALHNRVDGELKASLLHLIQEFVPFSGDGMGAYNRRLDPRTIEFGLDTPHTALPIPSGGETAWILEHAGLVLLHPFLSHFFEDCGVLGEKGSLKDPVLAMHLLYHVATKKEQPLEYELTFEKFICGWDLGIPIERYIDITQEQKEKAAYLVGSLIENWKRLKNTGVETVRTEFLQRSGKLIKEGESFRLVMEKKAQDILLEGLPYGLGVVKLPWRKELIFVEW